MGGKSAISGEVAALPCIPGTFLMTHTGIRPTSDSIVPRFALGATELCGRMVKEGLMPSPRQHATLVQRDCTASVRINDPVANAQENGLSAIMLASEPAKGP